MVEIITLITDIALGALAYRLARSNARALEDFKAKVEREIAELRIDVRALAELV